MIKLNQFLTGLFFLSVLFFAAKHWLLQLDINIPPALLGIAVLFFSLVLMKSVPKVISNAASSLLAHMSLFFIPAIVAIVNFTDLIVAFPVALFFSIVVSTLISLAITGWLSQQLMHRFDITNVSSDKQPKPPSKGN
jgi:holin-like protein